MSPKYVSIVWDVEPPINMKLIDDLWIGDEQKIIAEEVRDIAWELVNTRRFVLDTDSLEIFSKEIIKKLEEKFNIYCNANINIICDGWEMQIEIILPKPLDKIIITGFT